MRIRGTSRSLRDEALCQRSTTCGNANGAGAFDFNENREGSVGSGHCELCPFGSRLLSDLS
jgi:hypothetical protein